MELVAKTYAWRVRQYKFDYLNIIVESFKCISDNVTKNIVS